MTSPSNALERVVVRATSEARLRIGSPLAAYVAGFLERWQKHGMVEEQVAREFWDAGLAAGAELCLAPLAETRNEEALRRKQEGLDERRLRARATRGPDASRTGGDAPRAPEGGGLGVPDHPGVGPRVPGVRAHGEQLRRDGGADALHSRGAGNAPRRGAHGGARGDDVVPSVRVEDAAPGAGRGRTRQGPARGRAAQSRP